MGRNTLVDRQVLENLIVEAFKQYEKGLWPVCMRHEADAIINVAEIRKEENERRTEH